MQSAISEAERARGGTHSFVEFEGSVQIAIRWLPLVLRGATSSDYHMATRVDHAARTTFFTLLIVALLSSSSTAARGAQQQQPCFVVTSTTSRPLVGRYQRVQGGRSARTTADFPHRHDRAHPRLLLSTPGEGFPPRLGRQGGNRGTISDTGCGGVSSNSGSNCCGRRKNSRSRSRKACSVTLTATTSTAGGAAVGSETQEGEGAAAASVAAEELAIRRDAIRPGNGGDGGGGGVGRDGGEGSRATAAACEEGENPSEPK